MTSNRALLFLLILAAIAGCNTRNSRSGSTGNGALVSRVTLVSIAVTPANPSSAPETLRQFTAVGTYSNNTSNDLTASAAWSSSNSAVAFFDTKASSIGLVTVVAPGTTTITAASGDITGSTTLTVPRSITLSSLAIAPENPSIYVGTTEQFSVLGTYSDNSRQIPLSVVWSSSSPGVASISTTGLANALSTGTTSIIASSGSVSTFSTLTVTTPVPNILPITVNGSLCSPSNVINKPCVSVTICTPGTSTCRTINDILLDTGSIGIRIFKSALTGISPIQVSSGAGSLAGCVQFADGSSTWGPVMTADVILGQEPAISVPIQVIDATFGTIPTGVNGCGTPTQSPADAGFNGILGVGLFTEDCGAFCVNNATNGSYYTCSGTTCIGTKAALSSQVQNPVAHLPVDNNGVIVRLPDVPLGGTPSINGSLVLGIGTQSNNTPSGVTTYAANQIGEFITEFNGNIYTHSFIDSGSNAIFFNGAPVSLVPCSGFNTGWYCPLSLTTLSATNKGATGTPSNTVTFRIGNADGLFNSSNMVFGDLGGTMPSLSFDWGLPFYFGRNVFVGIEAKTSGLGTGPYWAY